VTTLDDPLRPGDEADWLEMARDTARAAARRLADDIWALATAIYEHPELGYEEVEASRRCAAMLSDRGFEVRLPVAGLDTAFAATYPGSEEARPGVRVALLAEYDALPDLGHACGHHLIAAAGIGAGLAVKEAIDRVREEYGLTPGAVTVFGSPAEEGAVDGAGGKAVLVEHGLFSGYDAALMFHPSNRTVAVTSSTAREALEVVFFGRAAHAAGAPHEGLNALDAVIQTYTALGALRSRLREGMLVHGVITDGGRAPNIIPERAAARFYVRCRDSERLDGLVEQVRACARGAALATGCRVEFHRFANRYETLVSNRALAGAFARRLEDCGYSVQEGTTGGGSTDMGNVSRVVPAIHPYVAICSGLPAHSREFCQAGAGDEARRATLAAAEALARTVLDLMGSPSLLRRVREEFSAGPGASRQN